MNVVVQELSPVGVERMDLDNQIVFSKELASFACPLED